MSCKHQRTNALFRLRQVIHKRGPFFLPLSYKQLARILLPQTFKAHQCLQKPTYKKRIIHSFSGHWTTLLYRLIKKDITC